MLSKTGIHAIRAVIALAELPEGAFAGATVIAQSIQAPKNYLGKLLQMLARDGLLESQKGLGGGFRLARDPRTITLLDVVEPIEHISRWNGCILGRETCSEQNPCAMHDRWKTVRDAYLVMLGETTIAQLLEKPKPVKIRR
ncbi:MAG TPA: Rrf2 family transcriptional regulator [bacterium]|nr:Rrf2 family transcriptional regulator [bacterium]